MATVLPFNGILYNQEIIGDLSAVVTPPYDVISPEEQIQFYERHPNNVVRLDFGKKTADDDEKNNVNTRAAGFFKDWIAQGILQRDSEPSLYLTTVAFQLGDCLITRYGMIALVGLEPFEKRIVLPHEKTFSKVKSERFDLIKACHANFSQIFSLYSDQEGILHLLKEAALDSKPLFDILDDKKDRHRMWRITEPAVHRKVQKLMEDKRLFIADGHHRYETALNYRAWRSKNDPDFTDNHPANYVMMYLCSMEDPGLVILPAHRMLHDVDSQIMKILPGKLEQYFEITRIPFAGKDQSKARKTLIDMLGAHESGNALGAYIKGSDAFLYLSLKQGVMETTFGHTIPESLRHLDVTVLTRLVLMEILGFDGNRLDNEHLISYTSSAEKAIDTVASGKSDMCFILNPTKIDQVRQIAEEGQIMPRKTTYFYPKALTGQVLNQLDRSDAG
ncbi:MAG: DUF1015 domain-containing protein [Desulfobacteraceae bacterium]|nr:MAG: DUF1015 domain-containing protein [Desulfobacteraceae bacterium]